MAICESCSGTGSMICPECNAEGIISSEISENIISNDIIANQSQCSTCDGSGQIACPICEGSGSI